MKRQNGPAPAPSGGFGAGPFLSLGLRQLRTEIYLRVSPVSLLCAAVSLLCMIGSYCEFAVCGCEFAVSACEFAVYPTTGLASPA
jgi:hypothetical protein